MQGKDIGMTEYRFERGEGNAMLLRPARVARGVKRKDPAAKAKQYFSYSFADLSEAYDTGRFSVHVKTGKTVE